MAIVNEKMTAIADKVRTLSGLEDSMSLDDMSNNLNDTCTEVDTQADLIAQITAALENKTSGGSDIDVSGVTATPSDVLAGKVFVDSTGTSQTGNIPTKTSSNLTANGATVSVPSGYYASTASKSVSTATQATPSITVSSSGLITASATQSAGYVSAGTKSGTKQLTTQGAKTITPSTNSQTAVASGRYTTGTVTVAAIPSNYEDVATETTEYTSLNDELEDVINSLPAAGGSGGGSVDTCTVKITCSTSDIYGYFYTKVVDGNYSMGYLTNETSESALDVTLTDVLCGGFISVQTGIDIGFLSVTISGDATYEVIRMTRSVLPIVAITAPTSPGSYSEVTIIDND